MNMNLYFIFAFLVTIVTVQCSHSKNVGKLNLSPDGTIQQNVNLAIPGLNEIPNGTDDMVRDDGVDEVAEEEEDVPWLLEDEEDDTTDVSGDSGDMSIYEYADDAYSHQYVEDVDADKESIDDEQNNDEEVKEYTKETGRYVGNDEAKKYVKFFTESSALNAFNDLGQFLFTLVLCNLFNLKLY